MKRHFFKILLLLLLSVSGCDPSDESVGPTVDQSSPTSCFTITHKNFIENHCQKYLFTLDASCSLDDMTPTTKLEVRWDYENDGVWDTEYSENKIIDNYTPVSTTNWSVTCQVRDSAGNTSQSTILFESEDIPVAPDIVAGSIFIESELGDIVSEVLVGQKFVIHTRETCLGNFLDPHFSIEIKVNGELLDTFNRGCNGSALNGCGGGGEGYYTLDFPGEYEITSYWDSDNIYNETNENNNSASTTLSVK